MDGVAHVRIARSYPTFYPDGPKNSDSFGRIVGVSHAQRIKDVLDRTKGKIVFGGDTDVENRYIAPTLVRDVAPDDPLMEQ